MKCFLAAAFLVACSVGAVSSAALLESDWLAPDDGLLTFDSSTGLEWLDISQTFLEDFPAGSLVEDRYQAIVAETSPGGIFEGFWVANASQAEQLASSAGLVLEDLDYERNEAATANLFSLIGTTRIRPEETALIGLMIDTSADHEARLAMIVARIVDSPRNAGAAFREGYQIATQSYPNPDREFGVFLIRTAIPEPNALILLGMGFLSMVIRSR